MKRDNKDMKVLLESWRGYVSADAEVLTEGEKRGEKMEERGHKEPMEEKRGDDDKMEEGAHEEKRGMEEGAHEDDKEKRGMDRDWET